MNYSDWIVGIVSVVLGLTILISGALNWEAAFKFRPARWIEAAWGRAAARTFYVLLGLSLIGLGIAISQGFGFNRSPPRVVRTWV